MITHSLIVCAFLAFSQVVEASTLTVDRMLAEAGLAETAAPQNAILYKEVGLLQGGETSRDVSEALAGHCNPATTCLSAATLVPARAQTITEVLLINQRSSGKGAVFFILAAMSALVILLIRKSSSTK
jgi:hypothetical protein